jgi:hypothetical protein
MFNQQVFKRLVSKLALPGWLLLAFDAAVRLLDWAGRLEFVKEKVTTMMPWIRSALDAVTSPTGQTCLIVGGFVFLVIVATRQGRPRLKVSYDGNSQDCMWPVTFKTQDGQVTWKATMARLRLDSETKSGVLECKAAITSLKKNAETVISGVQLPLLFTPADAPGSDTKTIKYGQSEYVELLQISDLGEAEIKTNIPFAFSEHQKLDHLATYSFNIAFSAGNILPKTIVIDAECKSGAWTLSIKRSSARSVSQAEPADRRLARRMAREECLDRSVSLLKKHYPFMLPMHAVYRAKAYKLESNDDLCWICAGLVKHGHRDPFCGFQAFILDSERLEFIQSARKQHGIDLSVGNSCLTAVQSWPEHKGRSQPTISHQESVGAGVEWELAGKEDWMNQLPPHDD